MIRSILFDFGGTIDTDGIHWSEKFWDIYQRIGFPVKKVDFERSYVAAEDEIKNGLISKSCTFSETLKIQAKYQLEYLANSGVIINDGKLDSTAGLIASECFVDISLAIRRSRAILKGLSDDYSLGLISNYYGNLQSVCDELDISPYFSALIDSSVVGYSKPDNRIFTLALQMLGTRAEDSLMVGDSYERDIVPAKLIGCTTIWLHGRNWKEPGEIDMADHCIKSLGQLPDLVGKIKSAG
jgi:FMN phosphatase YigB (HAD superfamily)